MEDPEEVEFSRLKVRMFEIGIELVSQDNRATSDPIFCIQTLECDAGFPVGWSDNKCWYDTCCSEWHYDSEPEFDDGEDHDLEEYTYQTRWVTKMVAFTEEGCRRYIRANGHNLRAGSYLGRIRVFVETLYRCQEMIDIRKFLIKSYDRERG